MRYVAVEGLRVSAIGLLGHPNTIAIPGARTLAQLEENAAATDLVLTDDEHARLTLEGEAFAAGARGTRRRGQQRRAYASRFWTELDGRPGAMVEALARPKMPLRHAGTDKGHVPARIQGPGRGGRAS
jgi:aryl-alcohol dehydrogenase-like predicted oxidoreductase